jgi:hypothetical protein
MRSRITWYHQQANKDTTMKTKFTATFSNGLTITRNSDHPYAFAWAIIRANGKIKCSGFSADLTNAHKGAESRMPKHLSNRDLKSHACRRYWAKRAKDAGITVEEWIEKIQDSVTAERAALRIEIVMLSLCS